MLLVDCFNDSIIKELKSKKSFIDRRYGEGSTKKRIKLSTGLSALYDEQRNVILNPELSKEETIRRLSDIRNRIEKMESEF